MKFIDTIDVKVCSGNGGSGCVSFRRERFIPKGGPDGGDGGKGGDLILRSCSERRTLQHLRFNSFFKAVDGKKGGSKNRTGKSGSDLIIDIPIGSVLFDIDNEKILHEFMIIDDCFVVASGGKGGHGNARFVSSINRAPRICQPGKSGRELNLRIELKLIADVGIIGLPNAGKSTLLSVISAAKPKIGDYPFTTLIPNLGFVDKSGIQPFIVADIPGLIKEAHKGVGLGIKFLKHIERSSVLIHLVDVSNTEVVLENIRIVERELRLFSKGLELKPCLLVLNKIDGCLDLESLSFLKKKLLSKKYNFLCISAVTLEGIEKLIYKVADYLSNFNLSIK